MNFVLASLRATICWPNLSAPEYRSANLLTVFTRLNAAAFIEFLAFGMRRLFEDGIYFKIISART